MITQRSIVNCMCKFEKLLLASRVAEAVGIEPTPVFETGAPVCKLHASGHMQKAPEGFEPSSSG